MSNKIYSNSKLSVFKQCPMKYKYQYVLKIKKRTIGIEAFVGSRVHETLEYLYSKILSKDQIPTLGNLLEFYKEIWEDRFNNKIKIVKNEKTKEHYFKIGEKCIKNYYDTNKPFANDGTFCIEKPIHHTTKYGDRIMGFIDRLEWSGNKLVIHDYKTGSNIPKNIHDDRQVCLYVLLCKNKYSEVDNIVAKWHFLRYCKTFTSFRTSNELDDLESEINSIIQEIENTKIFDPRPNKYCPWCEYKYICEEGEGDNKKWF